MAIVTDTLGHGLLRFILLYTSNETVGEICLVVMTLEYTVIPGACDGFVS